MNQDKKLSDFKKNIIAIGRLLWEKDLATGLNGNISLRVAEDEILLTGTKTCLGLLKETDIIHMNIDGTLLESGKVSTEKALHTEIYKNFLETKAVIHSHPSFTNGYFLSNEIFDSEVFESRLYLGRIRSIDQKTPNVSDLPPVIDELKANNIVVLRKHGVLTMGEELFDCFLLVQSLEEAIKVDVVKRLYSSQSSVVSGQHSAINPPEAKRATTDDQRSTEKYKLFSKEQINEIVRLVNDDAQLQELGKKTGMTMDLAVKMIEENIIFSFKFKDGQIVDVGRDENVEFLITAPEKVWRSVFNREIDPFVATTQKKMNLKGDFGRISKWYAPCSRLFELWANVPVE